MSALDVFKDAWKNRETIGDNNKTRELAAFLPAALEIQDAPPNPIAKWLSRSLILLFTIAVVWASFGKIDIVASAEGKIIPSSRVKQIQPLEKAVVKRILVREGERVSQGQALIELDSTLTEADKQRLGGELISAQLRQAVNRALQNLLSLSPQQLNQMDYGALQIEFPANASAQEQNLHKRLLWQQWQQYRAQWQALNSSLQRTHAERAATLEVVSKLVQTLPIISKRTATMKNLHAQNYASESDYLELEQARITQVQDLAAEKQRIKQLDAAKAEVEQQIKALNAQTSAGQLAELSEAARQIATLQEELAKATDLNAKQILYSPVSGQVQALAANTVGGVVTEAQQLMLIVPDQERLEVQVFLENKDIGFVHEGMDAEIKIHTFPFTKFGIIEGEITTISDDATVDENRGLIFGMQVLMAKSTILVNGNIIKLTPGMSVTAEIKTGKRRVIEFFLAPLLRKGMEGLRER